MSGLYFLSRYRLLALIPLMSLMLILQAVCTGYAFPMLRRERGKLAELFHETVILALCFIQFLYVEEVLYHSESAFMLVRFHAVPTMIIFVLLTLSSIVDSFRKKSPLPLAVLLPASVTLPPASETAYRIYPFLYVLQLCFWTLRSVEKIRRDIKKREKTLSLFSVKEAFDTMNSGILFFRNYGMSRGQIMLSNLKSQELMFTLTGQILYSGISFYEMLAENRVREDCHRKREIPGIVYELPDGGIFSFTIHNLKIKGKDYALLLASDVTQVFRTTAHLYKKEQELEIRNRELKEMIGNIGDICRNEESIRIRGRIHDFLGEKISFILHSIREHQDIDDKIISRLDFDILDEITTLRYDYNLALKTLAENFKDLGVRVQIRGTLPENSALQKLFFEIAQEAISNAVRHAYASEITISSASAKNLYNLRIIDNGHGCRHVSEGVGLSEMRRKTAFLGGLFSYKSYPHFSILIQIPKEGLNDQYPHCRRS